MEALAITIRNADGDDVELELSRPAADGSVNFTVTTDKTQHVIPLSQPTQAFLSGWLWANVSEQELKQKQQERQEQRQQQEV